MPKSVRRTSGDKDAGTRFSYPGANILGRARGSDAPLSERAKLLYGALIVALVIAVIVAIALLRPS